MEVIVITWFLMVAASSSNVQPLIVDKYDTEIECINNREKYKRMAREATGYPYQGAICFPSEKKVKK